MNELIVSVGAGRMGRGIAITFALAGYRVRLVDMKPRSGAAFEQLCDDARNEIASTLAMLSDFGVLDAAGVASKVALIDCHPLHDIAGALADADVIFEAVPETLKAKQAAFSLVSEHSRADAIVASTTSTILSNDLQPFVNPPERFLNAHWLNPAFLVPLVEVSPGDDTNPAVTERLQHLLEGMGKVPVLCAASPGYIVPRIQALAMNEAARMVEEGVASAEDIDKATRYGFGFRFAVLGLLEFIDWGGGDILFYASRYMSQAMNSERYAAPAIIETHMQEGRIGLRTQQGFLDYSTMDIPEYQRDKLSEFVGLLTHIGKLPSSSAVSRVHPAEKTEDATATIRRYLDAMERRDLALAQSFLAADFKMTFPGGVMFESLQELVNWSRTRYRSVGKTYERFDQSESDGETIVYCFGTLQGVWLDGGHFDGIRFVDRFVVENNLIRSQLVWNDLAEVLINES